MPRGKKDLDTIVAELTTAAREQLDTGLEKAVSALRFLRKLTAEGSEEQVGVDEALSHLDTIWEDHVHCSTETVSVPEGKK